MVIGSIEAYSSHQSVGGAPPPVPAKSRCQLLGALASAALATEAMLTPKPALVDKRGSGAHSDLTLQLMLNSALVLEPFFQEMAGISNGATATLSLRGALAECGRRAEIAMHQATGGSNSHRGAIWCLGLLVAAAALQEGKSDASEIAETAAKIAVFSDSHASNLETHGLIMKRTYGVGGARVEAQSGFPHVIKVGLPHLRMRRLAGAPESACTLDSLMAIMSSLDDTCLLYRGGPKALETAKSGAQEVLALGGTDNPRGMARLFQMDRDLVQLGASPGGSADLLAATLFLDSLDSLDRLDYFETRIRASAESIAKTLTTRRN
jgi:triphosphoribosyl-dephospho-CoA synthase